MMHTTPRPRGGDDPASLKTFVADMVRRLRRRPPRQRRARLLPDAKLATVHYHGGLSADVHVYTESEWSLLTTAERDLVDPVFLRGIVVGIAVTV